MITGLLIKMIAGVAGWVVSLLPNLPTPDAAMGGITSGIATVMGYAARMDSWIPFPAVGLALALVLPCLAAAVIIHFVRLVYSMFTGGGGAS